MAMPNSTLAMVAVADEMPENPKYPAITETAAAINAHFNMMNSSFGNRAMWRRTGFLDHHGQSCESRRFVATSSPRVHHDLAFQSARVIRFAALQIGLEVLDLPAGERGVVDVQIGLVDCQSRVGFVPNGAPRVYQSGK